MYLQTASLLVTAFLFGGMLLFSASFAAFLFKYLPPEDARMLIRKAFSPYLKLIKIIFNHPRVLYFENGSTKSLNPSHT